LKKIPTDAVLKKIKDLKDFPPYVVEWVDACSSSRWDSLEEARKDSDPIVCETRGRLIRADKKCLVLAQTVNAAGGVGGVWSIPRTWVIRARRTNA
jgi:hypothetical protein